MRRVAAWALAGCIAGCATTPSAPAEPQVERYAPIPQALQTPTEVSTRIGELRFFDGLPDPSTVDRVYAHLDFMRGVRAYLRTIPGVSMAAMRRGLDAAGMLPNYTVLLTKSLMDSRTRFLGGDTETVYALAWISLKGGPIVVETPARTRGVLLDAWQRPLVETGKAGPDGGRGGRYVIVPPAYQGYVPKSRFAVESPTYGVFAMFRGFLSKGSPKRAVAAFENDLQIYPLKESARPPPNVFVDISGRELDTIAPEGFAFFELLDELVQEEPNAAQDPEVLGLLAALGIEKDVRFEPDAETRAALAEAAAVGNATARALVVSPRAASARPHADRQWQHVLPTDGHDFVDRGARQLDEQTRFHMIATAIVPSETGEQKERARGLMAVFRDSRGAPLDGARRYVLRLPTGVPAEFFWSLTLYDNETRSMLQSGRRFPSVVSGQKGLRTDEDGAITLRFGPTPPRNRIQRGNFIQTVPGRGWNAILRVYGPTAAWFDGSWRPGDIEPEEGATRGPARGAPVPAGSEARDTRLGVLRSELGIPTEETVERLYDNLDFIRGVDAFLSMLPGASQVAMRRGLRDAGLDANEVVGVFDQGVDAHALLLTPSDGVHAMTWLDLDRGAVIVENPPRANATLDDSFLRRVADLGSAGPDEGKGGLFLFVPPRYEGQISERYFNFVSPTYGNLLAWREVPTAGGGTALVSSLRRSLRIEPLEIEITDAEIEAMQAGATAGAAEAGDAGELETESGEQDVVRFVPLGGKPFRTIPSSDFGLFEEIDELIQEEPDEAVGPELLGLLSAIGIEKGRPFAPSPALRGRLVEAATVANATARALAFRSRDRSAVRRDGSGWASPRIGNSARFERRGVRLLDARARYFYLTASASEGAASSGIGIGTEQVLVATDSEGKYFDGGRPYALTLPGPIPAKDSWSIVVYDPQTRSMLQTPNSARPTLGSGSGGVLQDANGSTTIYFGPEPPAGRESNWIPTVPGKGWFAMLRLHGPLEPWFDETWQPGEIEPMP